MSRIIFQPELPVVHSAPNRTDIACFIGFLSLRQGAKIPGAITTWLSQQVLPKRAGVDILKDVPVPIDDWAVFDRLFAWDQRSNNPDDGGTYVGCAVRSFFAQGGRKCYIIRMGDSVSPAVLQQHKNDLLGGLIPGTVIATDKGDLDFLLDPVKVAAGDRANWSGIGHVFGLPDVSYICFPDLPELVAHAPEAKPNIAEPPPKEEHFVECSPELQTPPDTITPEITAPRCNDQGYTLWARVLQRLQGLARQDALIREMQLIAAIPLPDEGSAASTDIFNYLSGNDAGLGVLAHLPSLEEVFLPHQILPSVASDSSARYGAFVQLAYPWLRTNRSASLAEGLENPEGVLAGVLARNSLTRGTFNSATKIDVADVFDVYPILRSDETQTPGLPATSAQPQPLQRNLVERVSLFAPTPAGISLISDVTIHPDETYRQARVNRLVAVITRAARTLGEDQVFESNGEHTWSLVRTHLTELMTNLWRLGALDGDKAEDAFSVACDRSTMTQNDIDNGRMVASISFTPAALIETITVLLSISATDTSFDPLLVVTGVGVA